MIVMSPPEMIGLTLFFGLFFSAFFAVSFWNLPIAGGNARVLKAVVGLYLPCFLFAGFWLTGGWAKVIALTGIGASIATILAFLSVLPVAVGLWFGLDIIPGHARLRKDFMAAVLHRNEQRQATNRAAVARLTEKLK